MYSVESNWVNAMQFVSAIVEPEEPEEEELDDDELLLEEDEFDKGQGVPLI